MGKITVNIGSLCLSNPGSIIHELGHVLGLWHQHVRPDRGSYIELLWDNIRPEARMAFDILPLIHLKTFHIKYDYGSIMHYSTFAFSRNKRPTMLPKKVHNETIGQRLRPSQSDYLEIRFLYRCQKCKK